MAVQLVPFTAAHLDLVADYQRRISGRPGDSAFHRWRHLECPRFLAILALRDDRECVAMVGAMRRRYRVGAAEVAILESHDWSCRPELLGGGLGVRVLMELMKRPEPILTVGGTEYTLKLVPKLKWRREADSFPHLLPLVGARLGGRLKQKLGLPEPVGERLFDLAGRTWFRPRSPSPPRGGTVEVMSTIGPQLQALYEEPSAYGTVQLPDPEHHQWLTRGYGAPGHFLTLYFRLAGRLRGWALGRIYPDGEDDLEAAIVDVYTPQADPDLYAWMIGEMAWRMAAFTPRLIRARASCPGLLEGLRRNRFLRGEASPYLVWGRGVTLRAPFHITRGTADEPLLPYEPISA